MSLALVPGVSRAPFAAAFPQSPSGLRPSPVRVLPVPGTEAGRASATPDRRRRNTRDRLPESFIIRDEVLPSLVAAALDFLLPIAAAIVILRASVSTSHHGPLIWNDDSDLRFLLLLSTAVVALRAVLRWGMHRVSCTFMIIRKMKVTRKKREMKDQKDFFNLKRIWQELKLFLFGIFS
ncbi:unnamed protein product [Amoebophrya sp. A25]|nr:unnamed protein product [Amoebophrya sp. A25]|eukprot:GSA25T00008102001.1